MNDKEFFTKPSVYATFTPAPNGIKKGFFARIIPYSYIKYTLYSVMVLFFSPIVLVMLNADLMLDQKTFYPIFWTLCILFLVYTMLAAAVLIFYKVPYMQELKEWFGYTER